jgi:NAD(P)-dependent dehydrogenase (short-subunit alcohol dehydrogenase family)
MAAMLGSMIVPGVSTWLASRSVLGLSWWPAAGLTAVGVIGGMIACKVLQMRVAIQDGFVFDYRCRVKADLTDKVVLITGATVGGLGHEAAKMLSALGATVVVTVRSEGKGKAAIAELGPKASYVVMDFLSKKSVREGAATVLARHSSLDVLVSNAGIGGSSEPADTWMANHIGPSIFISELQPLLEKTAKASGVRLVFVSSSSHKDGDIDYEKPCARRARATRARRRRPTRAVSARHTRPSRRPRIRRAPRGAARSAAQLRARQTGAQRRDRLPPVQARSDHVHARSAGPDACEAGAQRRERGPLHGHFAWRRLHQRAPDQRTARSPHRPRRTAHRATHRTCPLTHSRRERD